MPDESQRASGSEDSNGPGRDGSLSLKDVARGFIYGKDRGWAVTAFSLLTGRLSLLVQEHIQNGMRDAGIDVRLVRPDEVSPGTLSPRFVHDLGRLIREFLARRLAEMKRFNTDMVQARLQRGKRQLLAKTTAYLESLLAPASRRWLVGEDAVEKKSEGRVRALLARCTKLATYLPRTDLAVAVPVVHYFALVDGDLETLEAQREKLGPLTRVLRDRLAPSPRPGAPGNQLAAAGSEECTPSSRASWTVACTTRLRDVAFQAEFPPRADPVEFLSKFAGEISLAGTDGQNEAA